ncbi:hypothetical protein C4J81_16640 [Deltaproteobacteria bacterium Smac51]|nr:hypothetical protein C4J81_16640 [Deltaproteobacteria bacterium Smac51]
MIKNILTILCFSVLATGCASAGTRNLARHSDAVNDLKRLVNNRAIELYENTRPLNRSNNLLAEVLSQKPAQGDISSGYGMRKISLNKTARMHKGVDIRAQRGSPVTAAGDGHVSFVGTRGAYGKVVEIEHGGGLTTLYAHLDKYMVKNGQSVDEGQQIGTVGRTGRTTGPHLHFEVLVNNKNVDPQKVLAWGNGYFRQAEA